MTKKQSDPEGDALLDAWHQAGGISEALRRLPEELKARHPAIEWREMAAAGNFYATTTRTWRRAGCGIRFKTTYRRCAS